MSFGGWPSSCICSVQYNNQSKSLTQLKTNHTIWYTEQHTFTTSHWHSFTTNRSHWHNFTSNQSQWHNYTTKQCQWLNYQTQFYNQTKPLTQFYNQSHWHNFTTKQSVTIHNQQGSHDEGTDAHNRLLIKRVGLSSLSLSLFFFTLPFRFTLFKVFQI